MIAMTGNTSPTPAVASVPIRPTKKVSAMLYSAVTSMEMIVGTASEQISLGMDSAVMRMYLLFSWGICFTPLIYSNFVKYITK